MLAAKDLMRADCHGTDTLSQGDPYNMAVPFKSTLAHLSCVSLRRSWSTCAW